MKKLVFLLTALISLSAFATSPLKSVAINANIQKALNECDAALTDSAKYAVACPTFEKFTFKETTALVSKIESLKYLTLTNVTSEEATSNVIARMQGNLNYMKESGEYSAEVVNGYEASIKKISSIISSMGSSRNAQTFIDPNTYWAPSVNANATVIINMSKKTVYVIMMGDTDG